MFPNLDFNMAYPVMHKLDPGRKLDPSSSHRQAFEKALTYSWDADQLLCPVLTPGSMVPHIKIKSIVKKSESLQGDTRLEKSRAIR